ncbi:retrovirus-related pol polyprotein from transposon TNT 1-94, partial [Tanacetum coccineum]
MNSDNSAPHTNSNPSPPSLPTSSLNPQPVSLPPLGPLSSPTRCTSQSSLLNSPFHPNIHFAIRPTTSRPPRTSNIYSTHARIMHTRSMSGISKAKAPMNFLGIVSPCPIPRNPKDALYNSNWKNAMIGEFNALIENKTWELVPHTSDMHIISSMWIFRHKLRSDGSFERYKARLVGDGRSQQ